jgi:hypothetical protein
MVLLAKKAVKRDMKVTSLKNVRTSHEHGHSDYDVNWAIQVKFGLKCSESKKTEGS